MCIFAVATNFSNEFGFMLFHNRDEFYSRTSAPPKTVVVPSCCKKSHLLFMPTDLQSGGTWMGLNLRESKIVALTNVRAMSPPLNGRRSRGELVLKALCNQDMEEEKQHYYNYHLLELYLENPNKLSLTTSAPPTYKPCRVEYDCNTTNNNKQPFVATKSNDHGIGLTTTTASNNNNDNNKTIRWPKAVWLAEQVEHLLLSNPLNSKGQAGAKELLALLEPTMSATSMNYKNNKEVVPSLWNPLTRKQESLLSKAPFIEPFSLFDDDDDDSLYGTVSQSFLLYSSKEECLYYAYRETLYKKGEWMWQRVEL